MLKELIILVLIAAICYYAYQAMRPNESCNIVVSKPNNNITNTTALPKLDFGCGVS